jgi:hypothetical protein
MGEDGQGRAFWADPWILYLLVPLFFPSREALAGVGLL